VLVQLAAPLSGSTVTLPVPNQNSCWMKQGTQTYTLEVWDGARNVKLVYTVQPPTQTVRVLLNGANAFTFLPTQTSSTLGNGYEYYVTRVTNYYNDV
jgi:hypothetical protein